MVTPVTASSQRLLLMTAPKLTRQNSIFNHTFSKLAGGLRFWSLHPEMQIMHTPVVVEHSEYTWSDGAYIDSSIVVHSQASLERQHQSTNSTANTTTLLLLHVWGGTFDNSFQWVTATDTTGAAPNPCHASNHDGWHPT
jgi:hypothetical protein